MIGVVDENGRALISIEIAVGESQLAMPREAWIDTGFTGDLVLPMHVVEELSLGVAASVDMVLADGKQVMAPTFCCWVDWFDGRRKVEVIATDVAMPLLGVGLLLGHDVRISYTTMKVLVE